MKWIVTLALLSSAPSFASAGSKIVGVCAPQAAAAVMDVYGAAIAEGNLVEVITSKVSKNPSVYEVLVLVMDGSGEPFSVALDVTFEDEACNNPTVTYSK